MYQYGKLIKNIDNIYFNDNKNKYKSSIMNRNFFVFNELINILTKFKLIKKFSIQKLINVIFNYLYMTI